MLKDPEAWDVITGTGGAAKAQAWRCHSRQSLDLLFIQRYFAAFSP
jgi:shikimate 5-dehydrogenase